MVYARRHANQQPISIHHHFPLEGSQNHVEGDCQRVCKQTCTPSQEPQLDLSILKSTLTFIGLGATHSAHVLRDLLASRIVYWVCYFITRVSAKRENPRLRFQKEMAYLCTCSCTQILVLGRIMGYTWVAQMIDSGLLQAILQLKVLFKYSPALISADTVIERNLCDFLRSLVPYLAYRSVLRHTSHALREIRRKGLEDGFEEALQGDSKCLVRAWETLRDAIDKQWEFRERCFTKELAKDTCCYKPVRAVFFQLSLVSI